MKIETFYIEGAGWGYLVLDSEGFNTKTADSVWFRTEADAVSDAKVCYPDISEFILT